MYLIDTDILIYALRGRAQVMRKMEERASYPCAVSIVTYGEILYGAMKSSMKGFTLPRVRRVNELFPIVPLTPAVMETFASLKADLEGQGKRLEDFDLLIAATALVLNYCLVTNNERHFSRVPGLEIENWSKA